MKLSQIAGFGAFFFVASGDPLAPTDPITLFHKKVREFEQKNWLIEEPKELLSWEEPGHRYIQELGPDDVKIIADLALKIVYTPDQKAPKNCKELLKSVVACEYEFNSKSYIVLGYRPLLLLKDLSEIGLRYVYHSLARLTYEPVSNFITDNIGTYKTVILTGGSHGGLLAHYHGAMLIRKHPILGPCQNYINKFGMVQILTFNTPPPFSTTAVEYFHPHSNQFLDFRTINFPNEPVPLTVWATWARPIVSHCTLSKGKSNKDFKSISEWYTTQSLGQLDPPPSSDGELLASSIKAEELSKRMELLQETIGESVNLAPSVYDNHRILLENEALDECLIALQRSLKVKIDAKYQVSQEHTEKLQLNQKDNWALPGTNLKCEFASIGRKPFAKCYFHEKLLVAYKLTVEAFKHHEMGNYRGESSHLSLPTLVEDLDEKQKTDMEIASSQEEKTEKLYPQVYTDVDNPEEKTSSLSYKTPVDQIDLKLAQNLEKLGISPGSQSNLLTAKGKERDIQDFTSCLKDLFKTFPELKPLSPFSKKNLNLHYLTKNQLPGTCQATIVSSDTLLYNLYVQERQLYTGLMTGPGRQNPASCGAKTFPTLFSEHTNSKDYWEALIGYEVKKKVNFDESYGILENEKSQITANILKFLAESVGTDKPYEMEYNCTEAATLWHSPTFCPWFCRIWHNSEFCRRVYIGSSGIKASVRGQNSASKFLDNWGINFKQVKGLLRQTTDASYTNLLELSKLDTRLDHAWTMGFVLRIKSQVLYLTIFIEGSTLEEFKKVVKLK